MPLHAARLTQSPRLQRVADLLADGREHTTMEIVQAAQVCAVNSIVAELRANGPQSISSTGQMLPSLPWEAIWEPIARWFGVEPERMNQVIPNRPAFSSWSARMPTFEQVFDRGA